LYQNGTQIFVAFGGCGAFVFTGAFVVSWTQSRPAGYFSAILKDAHIAARLGNDNHGRQLAYAGNTPYQFHFLAIMFSTYPPHLTDTLFGLLLKEVVLLFLPLQLLTVMLLQVAGQRLAQFARLFVCRTAVNQFAKGIGIGFSANQRRNDVHHTFRPKITHATADAEAAHHHHPVHFLQGTNLLLLQLRVFATICPQLLYHRRGYHTATQQPFVKQTRYPLSILHITLPARHLLD
jgi:hypothetical protein